MTARPDNNNQVRVSVIIPTYNGVRFLKESIDSVLAQEHPACEVIVVDGASEDGTPDLCRQYGTRIRYFRQTRNEGVSSSLNLGIRTMKGDWFKQHDSDDILEANALQALATKAAQTNAKVIYGDFIIIDTQGRRLKVRHAISSHNRENFVVESWRQLAASHVSAMVHKTTFDTVGLYDESMDLAEDYDWFLRAVMVHQVRFEHIPVALARYRWHRSQLSRARWKRFPTGQGDLQRAKVRLLLTATVKTDSRLVEYYRSLTKRFRLTYAPLIPAIPMLRKAPRWTTASYYLSKLAPITYSRLYWASNPP